MQALLLAVLVSASPAKITLAAPGLNAINLDPKLVDFYQEHLAQQLAAQAIDVKSSKDIAALLGMERQRQLMGCGADEASCSAELAGALGAEGLLRGDIAKVAVSYQINLKVISSSGAVLATYAARTEDEEAVLGLVTQGARSLASQLYPKLLGGEAPMPVSTTVVARGGSLRRAAWIPAAGAVVLLGLGVVMQVLTEGEWSRLNPAPGATVPITEASHAASQGKSYQLWSAVLLSAGVACGAVAVLMFVMGGESAKVALFAAPDANGFALSLAGVFP